MAELIDETVHKSSICDHLVQVYRDPADLADAAATFLSAGFEVGEPAVVVATAAHWPLFSDRLESRGWSPVSLEDDGMLLLADADETLAAILENGQPSPARFTEVVGGLLDRASGPSRKRRVRAFGEMVDVLCRQGDSAAADALENLWNRLGARRNFSLLCGYKIDVFDRDASVTLLPQVFRSHSQVLPADPSGRMDSAVGAALTEVLGADDARKVYAAVARQSDGERIPTSQLALMWVSSHMPRAAERILASARKHYGIAATTTA